MAASPDVNLASVWHAVAANRACDAELDQAKRRPSAPNAPKDRMSHVGGRERHAAPRSAIDAGRPVRRIRSRAPRRARRPPRRRPRPAGRDEQTSTGRDVAARVSRPRGSRPASTAARPRHDRASRSGSTRSAARRSTPATSKPCSLPGRRRERLLEVERLASRSPVAVTTSTAGRRRAGQAARSARCRPECRRVVDRTAATPPSVAGSVTRQRLDTSVGRLARPRRRPSLAGRRPSMRQTHARIAGARPGVSNGRDDAVRSTRRP